MKKLSILFLMILLTVCSSCKKACDHEKEVIEEGPSTCTKEGYIVEVCTKCNEEYITKLPLSEHTYVDAGVIQTLTYTESEKRKYICSCCKEETIKETSFDDLTNKYSSLKPFDTQVTITNNIELYNLIDVALLNNIKTFSFKGNISNEFILNGHLISYMIPNTTSFNCNIKRIDDIYQVTLEYSDIPLKTSTQSKYVKKENLNYQEIARSRNNDFNDFAIEKKEESLEVFTTEQLSTCLMKGIKPICKENSSADVIYEIMKDILRDIIHDDMSDFDKALAIHDYLCSNVNYDYVVYEQSLNPMEYDCGWLEGIFLNQKGLCGSLSNAFMCLCNIEGIICFTVKGVYKENKSIGHAWNKVYLDSNWYIVDLTGDIVPLGVNTEVTLYQSFLTSDSYYNKYYETYIYNELECNLIYDKYSKITYIHQGQTNDYLINNLDELVHLISFLESNKDATISFKMNYEFNNFKEELDKAYFRLNLKNDVVYYTSQPNEYVIAN